MARQMIMYRIARKNTPSPTLPRERGRERMTNAPQHQQFRLAYFGAALRSSTATPSASIASISSLL
jgi:hypothetical protein